MVLVGVPAMCGEMYSTKPVREPIRHRPALCHRSLTMPNSGCRCRDTEMCNMVCPESALFQCVDPIGKLEIIADDQEKFKRIHLGRTVERASSRTLGPPWTCLGQRLARFDHSISLECRVKTIPSFCRCRRGISRNENPTSWTDQGLLLGSYGPRCP